MLQTRTMDDRAKVVRFTETHLPEMNDLPEECLTFYKKRDELSFEEKILLWKGRIYMPENLKDEIFLMLHEMIDMQSNAHSMCIGRT